MPNDQLADGAHASIYARKSTKDGGRSEGSQIEPCQLEADDRNSRVRKVFRDNVGASRHSRGERPDYEAMTTYITGNSPDVLLLWEVSRAGRKLRTWLNTVDLCKTTGTQICRMTGFMTRVELMTGAVSSLTGLTLSMSRTRPVSAQGVRWLGTPKPVAHMGQFSTATDVSTSTAGLSGR
ncbi:recombinase family protein [Micromonospora sp. II]|uniref:Resolvase/invertase-type recombinase catalytic domain-containing protein n=1 Tax=Micromonospora chalcea TaxID=1874 RepID=A0ABX9Y0S0_MICCH|nr:recombinase family protein [Micromonospora sp. II]RQW90644.1 hypothetical protein DLJ60_20045 [Micromonospora chalcea]RQX53696.1 hypothetical protein DLJ57_08880 [Micromonospora chalcea]